MSGQPTHPEPTLSPKPYALIYGVLRDRWRAAEGGSLQAPDGGALERPELA